ncbi:hypothetical protein DFH11DRAFT_1601873 [Phellopilus nigrolimitatus]|nr:hypothetical protein DFH11DRAFT_1601873 [Phellopilus nigrolimitatus]
MIITISSLSPLFCPVMTVKSRNMWVAVIKNYGWTRPLRAYLRFRRTLADPTKDEVEEMAQEMRTKKSLEDVTSAEIEDAFITGSLKICARGMQCVYYDEAFQRDLIKNFGNWTRKRKSENKVKDQSMERVVHENSSMVEKETVETGVDLRNSKRRRIDDSESEPGASEDSEVMNIDNLSEIRE